MWLRTNWVFTQRIWSFLALQKKAGLSILVIIFCFVTQGLPQNKGKVGYHILEEKKVAEIPFKLVNNLIIIPVYLNNVIPLEFILDTGVKTAILTDRIYSDILQYTYDRKITVQGAGIIQQVDAYVASNVSFTLPNVEANGQAILILEEDYLNLKNQLGVEVHGILGYEFFRRFVVQISYTERKITIYEPETFKPRRSYSRFNLVLEDTKPYIFCQFKDRENSKPIKLKLLMDTGASHALLLHRDEDLQFKLPEKTIYGNLGRGLVGDINGYIGRVDEVSIGDFHFEDVLTSFPDDDNYANATEWLDRSGTIGGELLSRFDVIIDYSHEAIYFRKNKTYKNPFIFSKTGMNVEATGFTLRDYIITYIREDSPAANAGICVGDQLFKINGIKASNFTLNEIIDKFRKRDGKKMKLVLLRKGEKVKTTFRLQNII